MKTKFYTILFLLAGSAGCDIVEKDATTESTANIKLYAAADKPSIIDLQKIFPSFTSVNVSSGLGNVKYFDDRYLRYQSPQVEGDHFTFDVFTTGRRTSANVSMTSQGEASCNDTAPFTYASIRSNEVLVVNMLNNPEFCGFDINRPLTLGGVWIDKPGDVHLNTDGLWISVCGCTTGQAAVLSYIPPAGFTGQVKFKYYVFMKYGNEQDPIDYNYGKEIWNHPEYADFYSTYEAIIDVTP